MPLASMEGMLLSGADMKRRMGVSQGTVSRLLQAAEQAVLDRDFTKATELTERAQRLDPASVKLLLYLGQVHCRNHELEKAWAVFERAARLSAKPASTLLEAGRCACHFTHFEMGHRCFESATHLSDAPPEVFAELAAALERLRRLGDAHGLVERALRMNPACGEARLAQARLLRQKGELAEAESVLRSHLPTMEKAVRIRAQYELGNILDRQGRFDDAMAAFHAAKHLLIPDSKRAALELQAIRKRLRQLRESIDTETMGSWLVTGAQLRRTYRLALLGGHPRSGTTLLEQVLDTHAEIISAEETQLFYDEAYKPVARGHKEQDNMLGILDRATTDQLDHARSNYFGRVEKFLGEPIGSRLLIDKNPSFTFLIAVFARIFPEARFLIALRDPRDVCISCFVQSIPLDQVSSAWLTLEGTVNEYIELMSMWLTMRPLLQGRAVEVRYEDMVADLEPVARKTLDFLGVDWDPRVLGFDSHAQQKAVRSPTYSDVTKKVFKTAVGRWRNYQKYLDPHLAKLEPLVKALGYE